MNAPRAYRLLCGCLLLGVVGMGVGGGWVAKHFYARELAVRLQPSAAQPPSLSGNPTGLRVLFLGDSRAAMWPALPADRFLSCNAGVPAETTAQIRLRAESALAQAKPAVVVFQAGINDLKAIGVFPEASANIQAQCLSNILDIIRQCRQHQVKVVLSLIIAPGKVSLARRWVWSPEINSAVQAVNERLRQEFQKADDVVVFDVDSILRANAPKDQPYADYLDTLHLAPSGYQKQESELIKAIGKLASTNPPAQ
jgi:lysophospholipase L1-like esterase